MIGTLLQKEFRQHLPWFILLPGVSALVVLLVCLGHNAWGMGAGIFSGVGAGLMWIQPVSAMILCHLLVATEYRNKTQIFLEGLPLQRWKMVSVKLFLAYLFAFLNALVSILLGWLFSLGTEAVTPQYLAILLCSAFGWAAFVTAFFFLMGFMGRYRLMIYLSLVIAWSVLTTTSIQMKNFAPFALIDSNRFGIEREIFPLASLQITGLIVLGLIAAAYAMALVKEGSLAAMLGEKMSYREKMFAGGFAVILMLSVLTYSGAPRPEPFDVPGAVEEEWDGAKVFVSPEDPERAVDLEVEIAGRLARNLAQQRDWLGLPRESFPKVYLVETTDIEEPEKIDPHAEVLDRSAVLIYADYRDKAFSEKRLLSWTLSQILVKISHGRVYHEDRWWIVCGLEGLWELEQAEEAEIQKRIEMAVAAVRKNGLTLNNLTGWNLYQDEAEWRSADAVAWMGMRLLKEKKGLDTIRELARSTVTQEFTRKDGRAVWWDFAHPVKPAFQRVVGIPLEEFTNQWREYILSHAASEPLSLEGTEIK